MGSDFIFRTVLRFLDQCDKASERHKFGFEVRNKFPGMSTRLKYWFNIGSFFETMKPNIRVLKLFGLFPYTISQAKGRSFPSNSHHSNNRCNHSKTLKSEVKFIDIAIFTLWQTFFLQMLYVSWPKMFLNMPVSRIITMVTLILYLLAGFNCSVSATLVLLFRKKFLHMVQLVEEADFLVNKAGNY